MFTIQDTGARRLKALIVSAAGNPALVDPNSTPAWEVDGPATIEPDTASPLEATLTPTGTLGLGQVRLTVDADMGAGVRPVHVIGDFEVVAGEAVGGTIELQPEAPPPPPEEPPV